MVFLPKKLMCWQSFNVASPDFLFISKHGKAFVEENNAESHCKCSRMSIKIINIITAPESRTVEFVPTSLILHVVT